MYLKSDSEQRSNCTVRICAAIKYDVEVTRLLQTTFATLASSQRLAGSPEAEIKADQSEFL